ncbi:hypothetical protein EIP86_000047 [Pleurotus ostreatoroseus]|nr:hypothetical protein EIP86_000047 [Pleurotus ostreatoroseus]
MDTSNDITLGTHAAVGKSGSFSAPRFRRSAEDSIVGNMGAPLDYGDEDGYGEEDVDRSVDLTYSFSGEQEGTEDGNIDKAWLFVSAKM